MNRRSRIRRLRTALVAGAVVGVSTLTGATGAQATPNVTDLETTVLRISGAAVTGANVPSGRTLTPVRLTTSDPVSSDRIEALSDGFILDGPIAPVTTRYATYPGQPGEDVTFRIDGTVVATRVPEFRYSYLQTNAGPVGARLFTANGVTYAITPRPVAGATRTKAKSRLEAPYSFFVTYSGGLLPVGNQPRTATAFSQSVSTGPVPGTGATRLVTVADADGVRRNGAPGEELVFPGAPAPSYQSLLGISGTEELTTVQLRNGTTVQVRSLSFEEVNAYGADRVTWLLDRNALAAVGATVADVTSVVTTVPSAHDATWQELGADRV